MRALVELGETSVLPEVDAAAAARLRHIHLTSPRAVVRRALGSIPPDLRRVLELSGISVGQLAALHREIGVTSAGELSTALADGEVARLGGFGPRDVQAITRALTELRGEDRLPLGRAFRVAGEVTRALEHACSATGRVTPVGSLRRYEPTVRDVSLLAEAEDVTRTIDAFVDLPMVVEVLHRGARKAVVRTERAPVALHVASPLAIGAALVHHTGSREHNLQLVALAAARGVRLSAAGFVEPDGRERAFASEAAVYDALGLEPIAPELRQGTGEIDAARSASLPRLVSREAIRGDLHVHTNWSDGRDSIETIVRAAIALGYEYVAITDHSVSSTSARGLSSARLLQQMEEIADVRRRVPGIAVLHGSEVDIRPDGRLDFPDELLERLDIVLASLHDSAGDAPSRLTERYLAAIRHPLVAIVTHPTNRMVGTTPGYELDFDRLFAAAVETGTVLEIDGAPVHLDMDGATARRATAAGVMVSIDSDGHRADALEGQMHFGVATARRGWVEASHVLNARPLGEVRAIIARKKQWRATA